jgi:ABC-type antimicrobial peptide transport system permease subunit
MNETSILMTLISESMFLVVISLVFGNSFGLLIGYGVSYLFLDGIFSINWSFFIYFNTGLLVASLILIFMSFRLNFNKNIKHLLS